MTKNHINSTTFLALIIKGTKVAVELVMRPKDNPISWEDFCSKAPPFSIAIDGYVAAGPCFQDSGPRLNLNHHEDVERLATRATCGQALFSIRAGLFQKFRDADGPKAFVYANDCDQDVCTTYFLLNNPEISESVVNPILNRLVGTEDALDTMAGAYPFAKDSKILRMHAWIYYPYTSFRSVGGVERKDANEFIGVVTDVESRIKRHLVGEGKEIPVDLRYRVIQAHSNWSMVQDIGIQSRTGMFADGIRAYVAVRERHNNRWSYTVGRMSQFIPFDVIKILNALSEVEGEKWGGGNTIGGSPRVNGSRLSVKEVAEVINQTLST